MEGNLEEKKNIIYCPNCGASNFDEDYFCASCGSKLIRKGESQQVDNFQTITPALQQSEPTQNNNKNEKKPSTSLIIVLAIISIVLGIIFPPILIIDIILGIISLFFKNYRPYGIAVLSALGILIVTVVLFVIIVFGMCFAGLG